MREDSQVTMTLAIADIPSDLLVIGVNGLDRLNAPFGFDIDLVSPDPAIDCAALLLRDAWLQIGVETSRTHGFHGQIQRAQRLYQGPDLSLYRLRLMPGLQRLDGPARRRSHNGQSVPQILARLLHSIGLENDAVRFDHLIGVYPAREHCLQYDESDLQFLHRLCEEEGISFRFEHHLRHHVLVFSDDPLGFPEWLAPVRVDHLAEQLSVRTSYSSHASEQYSPQSLLPERDGVDAVNQRLYSGMAAAAGQHQHQHQQTRARQLERLRCERREIMGRSSHPWLRGGLVVRVEAHPDACFNDQWLVIDVCHCAWQLAPLRGCASNDVIQILQAMASANVAGSGVARLLRPRSGLDRPALAGYENSFRVLPWAMPYRPTLEHPKPVVAATEVATQINEINDGPGRIRIRYDWQPDSPAGHEADSWARVVSGLGKQQAGARLQISFFEGDPDQPIICAAANTLPEALTSAGTPQSQHSQHSQHSHDDHQTRPMATDADDHLRIESVKPLTLRSRRATLHITEQEVHYTALGPTDDAS